MKYFFSIFSKNPKKYHMHLLFCGEILN